MPLYPFLILFSLCLLIRYIAVQFDQEELSTPFINFLLLLAFCYYFFDFSLRKRYWYWFKDPYAADRKNKNLEKRENIAEKELPSEYDASYRKLKEALKSKSDICFEYTNMQGQTATRHVKPTEIYFAGYGKVYIKGFDLDKQEERNFKVEKMKNLQILSSSQTKSTDKDSEFLLTLKTYSKTIFILIGIQASGKSSFANRFLGNCTHISLDQLNTRRNEETALKVALLIMKENCVIDNTNPTRQERQKYIDLGKKAGYKIVGLYFRSVIDECIKRNDKRFGKAKIPLKGLLATAKRLQQPALQEGFDELYYVKIENKEFVISKWDETL